MPGETSLEYDEPYRPGDDQMLLGHTHTDDLATSYGRAKLDACSWRPSFLECRRQRYSWLAPLATIILLPLVLPAGEVVSLTDAAAAGALSFARSKDPQMPVVSSTSISLAVHNISRFGDTDVFPYPLENHWLHDKPDVVHGLLTAIDAEFDTFVVEYPVLFVKALTSVGYAGFRAATQIDPIWNAYLLSLVLELGREVESARVSPERGLVFSYRFTPDGGRQTLFDPQVGWRAYQLAALARAEAAEFVLATDITDFYPRIYHHRLENALQQVTTNKEAVRRIRVLLTHLSANTSYGLPVGGNAARLLAELVLNAADKLLLARRVEFVRFVDDYYVFGKTREDVQRALVFLSEFLLTEGLSLSRAKTRFMTKAEFLRASPVSDAAGADADEDTEGRRFLRLRLAYDPYSATADDDYNALAQELKRFDIVGMLAREFRKSRIDEVLVRQLVKSMRYLEPTVREHAVDSLLANLDLLYPVFPTVAILLRSILDDLDPAVRQRTFSSFRELLSRRSHIVMVPTNLVFAIRLLAQDQSDETVALLVETFDGPHTNMMVKRDIILAMARRRASYWLSPLLRQFAIVTPWERRALLVASYVLGDEGRHWRESVRKQLLPVEKAYLEWVGTKNNGQVWEVPL